MVNKKATAVLKPYKSTGIKYLSPEWETARKHLGIGGSEASAIAGFNPYSSAYSAYWDKVGNIPPKPISGAMRQGSDLEEYVAQPLCECNGQTVKRNAFMLCSMALPFFLADIYRFVGR